LQVSRSSPVRLVFCNLKFMVIALSDIKCSIILVVLSVVCLSCQRDSNNDGMEKQVIAFDETKWKTQKGLDFPYRDSMLENLMSNQLIRAYHKDEMLELLGEPGRMDGDYLFYEIWEKRLYFWPLTTKSLVIHFYEDSTVHWMKIHE